MTTGIWEMHIGLGVLGHQEIWRPVRRTLTAISRVLYIVFLHGYE